MDFAAFIVSVHVPVPVHAPLHPAKTDPASGVAVSVTAVPLSNVAPHVGAQAIPIGLLAADPPPIPAIVTVKDSPPTCGDIVTL
jgi:hypothetical protein